MKTLIMTLLVVVLTTFSSNFNACQAQNPYGEVNFAKIKPHPEVWTWTMTMLPCPYFLVAWK